MGHPDNVHSIVNYSLNGGIIDLNEAIDHGAIINANSLMHVNDTNFAMFLVVKMSPGTQPQIVVSGQRESEQPIHNICER